MEDMLYGIKPQYSNRKKKIEADTRAIGREVQCLSAGSHKVGKWSFP